ncbi:ATP-binding protein [Catenuloplanes japonicus]|uniref:ATP-binding protein n=1 Tax=Catenuloplanes japonicus TaxID=33876 RepID=UPI000526FC9D|nr:tetratricopeptide repeat protein [Catenuloplanes japonicus]
MSCRFASEATIGRPASLAAVVPADDGGTIAAHHALPPAALLVGRDRELQCLTGAPATGHHLLLVSGLAGAGKTTLALHAARRLSPRFPDAQFHVDLRGHHPTEPPVTPNDALHQLLTADGVPATRIAADVEGRSAQWRTILTGRRILIMLDDAQQRSQVTPLLPGDDGCLVLVTSRRRLTGLIAAYPATTVELDTLATDHAVELFAQRSGRDRHGDDAPAIREIVEICGLLPLPICLLAARLRTQPRRHAADLLHELRQAAHPTARMRAEDLAVGPAFDLSFRRLPPARRRFLRRLAMHPGSDLDVAAAAALAGVGLEPARTHLDALFQEHLLDQRTDGHYRMHALISDHARSRGGEDGDAAVTRLAEHYVRRLRDGAAALTVPYRAQDRAERIRARVAALAWFQQQRASLLSCATTLARIGAHQLLTALAAGLAPFFREAGPWEQAIALQQAATDSSVRQHDDAGHAAALRELGEVHYQRGHHSDAIAALRGALAVLRHRPDRDALEALVRTRLGAALRQKGKPAEAVAVLTEALGTLRRQEDRVGEAEALMELGMARTRLADHDGAVTALREAVAMQQRHGSLQSCALTLNHLGAVLQYRGDREEAAGAHQRALELYGMLNDLHGQAAAHNYLGHLWCEAGEYRRAAEVLAASLPLHDRLGSTGVGLSNALLYLGHAYRELGHYEEAREATRRALALYRNLGSLAGYADGLNRMGIIHRLSGDLDAAADAHREALDVFAQLADPLGQAEVLNALGHLEHMRGFPSLAIARHRSALAFALRAGNEAERERAGQGIDRCLGTTGGTG